MKLIHGYANITDLTIRIQFHINAVCSLIKIPQYGYSYKERESLGNGWYSDSKTTVTAIQNNDYLVVLDNKVLGKICATENGRCQLQGKNSFKKNKAINNLIKEKELLK